MVNWLNISENSGVVMPETISVARCLSCNRFTFWEKRELRYPAGSGIKPIEGMPENVKVVFEEAQSISNLSPRASAALLRVCLERLVAAVGGKGGSLQKKIESLGLNPRMQKLCEACRLSGNEAVHHDGFDFSASNEESKALVFSLSKFINRLAEDFYTVEAEADAAIERMKAATEKH